MYTQKILAFQLASVLRPSSLIAISKDIRTHRRIKKPIINWWFILFIFSIKSLMTIKCHNGHYGKAQFWNVLSFSCSFSLHLSSKCIIRISRVHTYKWSIYTGIVSIFFVRNSLWCFCKKAIMSHSFRGHSLFGRMYVKGH